MKNTVVAMMVAAVAALGGCSQEQQVDKPVKISVFSGTLNRVAKQEKTDLKGAAKLLIAAGVTGFDCAYNDKQIPDLVQTDMKPINFFGFPKFLAADGGAADIDLFVSQAVKYKVPRIMCVPDNFPAGCDLDATFEKILVGVKKLALKAQAANIAITVEDFGGTNNPCSYAKYLKRFLDEVPGIGFALDSGNMYYAGRGDDIRDMMRYTKGRIRHVHLKDQKKDDNHAYITLGEGGVPNEEVVRTVNKWGYNGWYTLENPVGNILEDVRKQAALVNAWCE